MAKTIKEKTTKKNTTSKEVVVKENKTENKAVKEKTYTFTFAKTREVTTPSRAWDAAGWDLNMPTNLTIKDFIKNYNIYDNDNLVYHKKMSPTFYLYNRTDDKTLSIKFRKEYDNIIYYNCNSGMDIAPAWNVWIESDNTCITSIDMDPGDKIIIPFGIHINLPNDIFMQVTNKSGIASKRGLVTGACLIDPDYTGEILVNLINVSNNSVIINANDKLVQIVPHFLPKMNTIKEMSLDELYKNKNSERGEGGFGSSNN